MRLYYLPGTAAMAPHATLAEIGAPYELVRVERDEDGRPSDAYQSISMTGRTSTDPVRAFGMRAAQSMAVSNDSTSSRK
jgi:hypothetical protein